MTKLLSTLFVLLCLFGGSQNASAGQPRNGVGPTVAVAATTYYPNATGFKVSAFDGDMTVATWWRGSGNVSIEIQASLFTAAEDPSNLSFYTVATRGPANRLDSVIGPVERIRFYTATCTGDCTTSLKVFGRVAP